MKSTYNAIIHRICINQIFSTNINIYTQHEKIYIRENSVHKFNVQRKFQKLFHKRWNANRAQERSPLVCTSQENIKAIDFNAPRTRESANIAPAGKAEK